MQSIEIPEYSESHLLELTDQDARFLETNHKSHLSITREKNGFILKAKSYVGFIKLSDKIIYLKPKIPDDNLLFILSYIYDRIELLEAVDYHEDRVNSVLDMMIFILTEWAGKLIKTGILRKYVNKIEKIPRVRGKIIPSKNILYFDKLVCSFDELSYSVRENMILKATLRIILGLETRDILKNRAKTLIKLLAEVNDIELSNGYFYRLNYSRLNRKYDKIIQLCYLIFKNYSVYQSINNIQLHGFLIDMNMVFEEFIRNYLVNNLSGREVKRRILSRWAKGDKMEFLPAMIPDIVVEDKMVIDVKYYRDILGVNGKFHSPHLYQLLSYMDILGMNGMLVYPGHESHFEEIFHINDKAFMMKTIDMAGTRQHLQDEMDSLVQLIERGLQ